MKTALAIALTLVILFPWVVRSASPTPEPAETLHGRQEIVLDNSNTANVMIYGYGEPPRYICRAANGTEAAPKGVQKDSLFCWDVAQAWDATDGQWHTLGNTEWRVEEEPSGKNAIPGAYSIWTVNGKDASGYPYINTEKVRILNDGTLVVGVGDGINAKGEPDNHIGERSIKSVLGGKIRSPDLAPGVADQAGADLKLECGAGTGQGTDCRIIFRVDVSDGPGTEVKRKYTLAVFGRGLAAFNAPLSIQGVTLTGSQLDRLLELIGE